MSQAALGLRQHAPRRVLSGFGGSVRAAARYVAPETVEELIAVVERAREERLPITMRGAGRSYGDASLSPDGIALDVRRMNRMLAWDPVAGVVDVEPGFTIEDLWRRTLADGYWPAVVPGTMFPTLAGCISMNVHGKNNFAVGPIGDHVLALEVLTPDGDLVECSRQENSDFFHAVIGGAGLLGVVTRIRLKLKKVESGLLRVEPMVSRSFAEMLSQFESRIEGADYLVGWIDCLADGDALGRGEIHRANYVHADADPEAAASLKIERQILPSSIFGIPRSQVWRFMRPFWNDVGMHVVNGVKYLGALRHRPGKTYLQSHVAFAFLLDYVPGWQRAFGPEGFVQYQIFVPKETVREVIPSVLKHCQAAGVLPYLGVFKRHRTDDFLLSHAVDGYSLALDFSARNFERLHKTAHELSAIVLGGGGRFYLAKDSLISAEEFRRAYGARVDSFLQIKAAVDPEGLMTSVQGRRLGLSR